MPGSASVQKRHLKAVSSNASSPDRRQRLTGKQPGNSPGPKAKDARKKPAKGKQVDPWDPNGSIAEVFGEEETGASLIEKIFSVYGDPKEELLNVPWFAEDGSGRPNLVADPLNRPLQLSTVADYKQRIFQSGLAEDCSGLLVRCWIGFGVLTVELLAD